MRKAICLLAIAALVLSLSSAVWAAKPIKLKAVQFVPMGNPGEKSFHLVVDMINKASNGELNIKIVGGPEAIPGRQQPEAVRTGAVDICYDPVSRYRSTVPVALLMNLSLLNAQQERESGFYDFLVKEHEKGGFRYFLNADVMAPFHLYSKTPIEGPQELKGKRFRHSATYMFYDAVGLVPVTAAAGEIYTGLERSLFEGLTINHTQFIHYNLYEVAKYVIGPGIWARGSASIIMNLQKFNSLPKHLQDVIVDVIEKAEPLIDDLHKEIVSSQTKKLESHGVKHIEWSPEDSKSFLDTVNKAAWEKWSEDMSQEQVSEIRKMMGY